MKDVAREFNFNHLTTPYVSDSGSNVKAAFKNGEWYACLCHRLHTVISDAWKHSIENDVEMKLLYQKMLSTRTFMHHANDVESMLPKKLPKDCSRDFDPPTDRNLMSQILEALRVFQEPFKQMQTINEPTLHLSILYYVERVIKIRKFPSRLDVFARKVIEGISFIIIS